MHLVRVQGVEIRGKLPSAALALDVYPSIELRDRVLSVRPAFHEQLHHLGVPLGCGVHKGCEDHCREIRVCPCVEESFDGDVAVDTSAATSQCRHQGIGHRRASGEVRGVGRSPICRNCCHHLLGLRAELVARHAYAHGLVIAVLEKNDAVSGGEKAKVSLGQQKAITTTRNTYIRIHICT